MNILLLGSGGREHALAWKLAQSRFIAADGGTLYACPGNPGIGEYAQLIELDVTDHDAVARFCSANGVDFVVVGLTQHPRDHVPECHHLPRGGRYEFLKLATERPRQR